MDSAAFLLAIFGVGLSIYWVWRNDRARPGGKTSGVLAMFETAAPDAIPAEEPEPVRRGRGQRPAKGRRPYWERSADETPAGPDAG